MENMRVDVVVLMWSLGVLAILFSLIPLYIDDYSMCHYIEILRSWTLSNNNSLYP
jgi:hypothetical protein